MNFFVLILLGVIQGLTEFLPVSSSGHLVLLYNIFGIENNTITFSILLHVTTLFSVIIYYRKELFLLIKNPLCSTNRKMVVTTIVTCGLVLIIKPFIVQTFDGRYLFIAFIATGILLLISDYMSKRHQVLPKSVSSVPKSGVSRLLVQDITNIKISYKQALIIGFTQGIACIPGISRSGSTIAAARISGAREDSTTYSFLISIPIIIASVLLDVMEGGSLGSINIFATIIAIVICFAVGLLCIRVMTNFASKNKLSVFSYYLFALATFIVVNNTFLHWF